MAEEIHYDYGSMDNAYENMKRIAGKIEGSCQDMSSDALRLLQSNGGAYADGYGIKVRNLNANIDELNSEMTDRAKDLQSRFGEMGETDVILGDGF